MNSLAVITPFKWEQTANMSHAIHKKDKKYFQNNKTRVFFLDQVFFCIDRLTYVRGDGGGGFS